MCFLIHSFVLFNSYRKIIKVKTYQTIKHRKRSRKKPAALTVKEKSVVSGGGIDLESSGEFASVEKMLATTDANKFSTYLQTGAADLGGKRGRREEGHVKDDRAEEQVTH